MAGEREGERHTWEEGLNNADGRERTKGRTKEIKVGERGRRQIKKTRQQKKKEWNGEIRQKKKEGEIAGGDRENAERVLEGGWE